MTNTLIFCYFDYIDERALTANQANFPYYSNRPTVLSAPPATSGCRPAPGCSFTRRLTLVSAPDGYGKTSQVASWVRVLAVPVAWLALDEGDNDSLRFIGYLVAAMSGAIESVGKTSRDLLSVSQLPPFQVVLTSFINDLTAVKQPLV